jgi:hypothetical protein
MGMWALVGNSRASAVVGLGRTNGVLVGIGVAEIRAAGVMLTPIVSTEVGVQVGGRAAGVEVDVGMNNVGRAVAGGNGFIEDDGFRKIKPTINPRRMTPNSKIIDSKSQIDVFIYIPNQWSDD